VVIFLYFVSFFVHPSILLLLSGGTIFLRYGNFHKNGECMKRKSNNFAAMPLPVCEQTETAL